MNYLINIQTDIGESLKHTIVASPLIQYNEKANVFRITVMNGSTPVNLDTVDAYFIRGDNTTVQLPSEACVVSANVVSVTLTDVCYAVTGPAVLTVNDIDTQNDVTMCIGRFECVVARASTDSIVDPGEIIPSVNNLMNQIENAVASIPEDYSQMSQDVEDLKAEAELYPLEYGGVSGSMQTKRFEDDNTEYVQNAFAVGSFAEGANTTTCGKFSHAEGKNTIACGVGAHSEGLASDNYLFKIKVTTSGNALSTLFRYEDVDPNHPLSSVGIDEYLIITDSAFSNSYNVARKVVAYNGIDKTLTLQSRLPALVTNASAIITRCAAVDAGAHSEGYDCFASGAGSHAEGHGSMAFLSGHAEGAYCQANGQASHAEGYLTQATSTYGHAEGDSSIAQGPTSHAEGSHTLAKGFQSHAEGSYTIANSQQHVEGVLNVEDTEGRYLHIVGNGTTVNNRSNAYTLDKQGNGTYAGNITANGGSLVLHGANGDVTLTAEILARIIADYSA